MIIEIVNSSISSAQLWISDQVHNSKPSLIKNNCIFWDIEVVDCEIIINFNPDSVDKPLLRIDGFLVDYWTAKIEHRPGFLKFWYNKNFFNVYHTNNLQDRLNSLGENPSALTVDRVVGRNLHSELVNELLKTINEKSTPN
jgi:hypothetical protein